MTNLLKPFQKNQKHFEGKKYPTSCWVSFAIHQCRKSLEADVMNTDFPSIQAVSTSLQIQFEKYLGESSNPAFNAEVVCGYQQLQVGIHWVFFVATFFNPAMKLLNGIGIERGSKLLLKLKVLELMMSYATGGNEVNGNDDDNGEDGNAIVINNDAVDDDTMNDLQSMFASNNCIVVQ